MASLPAARTLRAASREYSNPGKTAIVQGNGSFRNGSSCLRLCPASSKMNMMVPRCLTGKGRSGVGAAGVNPEIARGGCTRAGAFSGTAFGVTALGSAVFSSGAFAGLCLTASTFSGPGRLVRASEARCGAATVGPPDCVGTLDCAGAFGCLDRLCGDADETVSTGAPSPFGGVRSTSSVGCVGSLGEGGGDKAVGLLADSESAACFFSVAGRMLSGWAGSWRITPNRMMKMPAETPKIAAIRIKFARNRFRLNAFRLRGDRPFFREEPPAARFFRSIGYQDKESLTRCQPQEYAIARSSSERLFSFRIARSSTWRIVSAETPYCAPIVLRV